jgi:Flp pilus assembly protein TadD
VIELAPERDDARWRLAQCLQKLDLLSEAAFHLDYLHRRYPENREMTVELARNQFKQGQEDDARQLLQTVLHDDPDCISALVERGRIALSASDAAGAETSLRRAIHLNPNDRQALHLLSLTLSRQGSLEEAEKFQDRLKQTERAFQRLAEICLHELGKNPHNPLLHEELGALLLRLGYREAGRNWLLLALEDHPHASRVRALLRSADLESGEKSQPGRYPPRSSEPDTGASS